MAQNDTHEDKKQQVGFVVQLRTIIVHLDDKGFPKGYEGLQYLDVTRDNFDKKLIGGIANCASSVFTVKPKR